MAVSELTRDQKQQLDAITPILDDAFVAGMSRHEAKNYRELLSARDQAEEFMKADNAAAKPASRQSTAPMSPVQSSTALTVEEAIPADLLPPGPTPEPTPAPKTEVIAAQPEPVTDIPEPVSDPADILSWQEKLNTVTKRYKDLQASVSPTQQAAASLRKKLKAEEQENNDLRSEFTERMDRLEKLLLESKTPPPAPVVTKDPFEGLAEVDPDLDARLRAFQAANDAQAKAQQARVDALERQLKAREEADREAVNRAYVAEHDAKVASLVPDFKGLLGTDEGRNAIKTWMANQAPMMQRVLADPYNHTPHDVAFVLNKFKNDNKGLNGAKKPSLGDLAANVKLSPATPLNEASPGNDLFTDAEMNNLDAMMHNAHRRGEDLEALVAKAERTMAYKQKQMQRR